MRIYTHEIIIPKQDLDLSGLEGLQKCYNLYIRPNLPIQHRVIRFVITKTDENGYHCELDVVVSEAEKESVYLPPNAGVFDFRHRNYENNNKFNAVLLIPTGIGAELGGNCGDGNAVARLIASACDTLITHPNVLNASDLNEMTENTLYVEGSIVTKLLMGEIGLEKVRSNRILMLMDKHDEQLFNDEVINAISSARITLGLDCDVHEMQDIVSSVSRYSKSGRAVGEINSLEKIFEIVQKQKKYYDAIGLSTLIRVPDGYHEKYFKVDDMVNPWGGIEAMLTHSIAETFGIPCAHSPLMTSSDVMSIELGIVDPRKAPETSSVTYLHCILKGLHKAPRVVGPTSGLTLEDINCLIIPDGCIGLPTLAALENNIPVIAVKENKNNMKNDLRSLPFKRNKLFIVENYLEAVGIMTALKGGVSPDTIRRPIPYTAII